jgi:hypothetical protein
VAARRAAENAQAPAHSHQLATIARKATGPFVAYASQGGLAAWMIGAERGGGEELVVVPFAADGAPLAPPHVVAKLAQEAMSLAVRPMGGGHGGWSLVWSVLLDRGEALTALALAPDGTARGEPTDVQRTSDHVKWADAVPVARGSVCVWAEETTAGDANILAVAMDSDGRPRGVPARVARRVSRWQALRAADGVALALVADDKAAGASPAGRLSWLRLDADGHVLASASIGARPTVSSDVDVVAVRDGWVLGWTDRSGEDPQVMLARVDEGGRVQGPVPAMDPLGGSALVGLAANADGVTLAWEEPRGRARPMRPLNVAAVDSGLSARTVTSLQVDGSRHAELVAIDHGFGLLTAGHACAADAAAGACAGPVVPTFVRFDAQLQPVQAEPIFLGSERADAAMAWGLRCAGDRCVALAATSEAPTPIFAVDLSPRAAPFGAPRQPAPVPNAPRVTGVRTLASDQLYAEVGAARVGDVTLLATLADGVVAVRAVGEDGRALGPPLTLATRASSTGGLAIAAGAAPDDGAAVAWVARDDGDPQVHLARVDRRGKRVQEVQLTSARGDAGSVSLAWAGDGWLVAWVDGRDGNGEVYATKVTRELGRAAREERITSAPGDASDVALLVQGEHAWLAWSDPRESPREGLGDIYATTLRLRDAKRASPELRVLATAAHSRSPELAPARLEHYDRAVVVWIDDAPTGLDAAGIVLAAQLDADGRLAGSPTRLPLSAAGRPSSLAVAPSLEGPRVAVARSTGDEVGIDLLALRGLAAEGRVWPLVELDAPASFDVAMALAGGALYFDDVGASLTRHRVRRAAIDWGR